MTLAVYQMQLQRSNQRLTCFDGATPKLIRELEQAHNKRLRALVAAEVSEPAPLDGSERSSRDLRLHRGEFALAH